MGAWEAFYASELQHPWLLWAVALLAGAFVLARSGLRPSLRRYCVALVGLSFADAWLTSTQPYGVGPLTGQVARLAPLFFVLAGDFRFLLLVEAGTPERGIRFETRGLLAAAALTAIVPVFSQIVLVFLPEAGSRVLFLVYEVSFFALTLVLMRTHPGLRARSWVRPVARFVLLYYGLWAAADVLILAAGSDAGYALRVLPNLLYYGGLIAMIAYAGSGSGFAQDHEDPLEH